VGRNPPAPRNQQPATCNLQQPATAITNSCLRKPPPPRPPAAASSSLTPVPERERPPPPSAPPCAPPATACPCSSSNSSRAHGTTASSTPPRVLNDAAGALNTPAAPFVIRQLGRGFVKVGGAETDPEDIRLVEAAWDTSAAAILSGDWDLVVLDEINYAISYGMLSPERVAEVLRRKPEMTHVILTGRNAHPLLVELADTVTEMREVKHAYQRNILAQRGIEF
jgi:cob(I)alamin adenosyltransferase